MMRFATLAATCLVLTACGSEPDAAPPEADESSARGEVLGGTISDAMIPLDTVNSQVENDADSDAEEEDAPSED